MPSQPPFDFPHRAPEVSTRELARFYETTEAVVRRWRSQAGIPAPAPPVRTFLPETLTLESFVLTSDWHIPYHDQDLINRVLRVAVGGGLPVVIVGDLIDLPTISRFEPRDVDSTVGMEVSAVGDVLQPFLDLNVPIHWSRGNHELRFFRALRHQVDMDDLARLCLGDTSELVRGYESEELVVNHPSWEGDAWLLSHPQVYSATPLALPRRLQQKHGCNVASGHTHQYAMGYAPDGRHMLLETGGLFDPGKLAYLHRGGATFFPHQQRGFWVIERGKAVMP